ncbi:MAG: hypothetical protein ACR2ML_00490 [Solirubrobacteraceae bacterium]
MPARRTLIVLTVLLAALAVGAALDAGGRDEQTATRPAPSPTAGSPPSRTIAATVAAAAPATPTVRARVGDLVKLAVVSRAAGTVALDGYDRIEPVGPQSPARLSFTAQRAGSFPVRFRDSIEGVDGSREGPQGRRIGLLVVEVAQPTG